MMRCIMKQEKKLIQISVPMDLFKAIEKDREETLLSKTSWFILAAKEKLVKDKKKESFKRIIDL